MKALALVVLALLASSVHAIVSDRHLRGVNALECDLEAGDGGTAIAFKLLVRAKERRMQLAGTNQPFAYEELSESSLRFPLALAHGPVLSCDLELPAGALVCRNRSNPEAKPRLGLCLAAPN